MMYVPSQHPIALALFRHSKVISQLRFCPVGFVPYRGLQSQRTYAIADNQVDQKSTVSVFPLRFCPVGFVPLCGPRSQCVYSFWSNEVSKLCAVINSIHTWYNRAH